MTAFSATLALKNVEGSIRSDFKKWLLWTLAIAVSYHLILLGSLMFRFGAVPNYVTFYNWPANVWHIIQSTPSVSDMLPIIRDEWLVEIGYMNYDFGHGISEWSLSLQPPKMAIVLLFSALITTNFFLLAGMRKSCPAGTVQSAGAATGLGTLLVGMTSATMSWVVCCATPSWVVGLAMLGVGVSTSLWLEPLGVWLTIAGFSLLGLTTFVLAGLKQSPPATSGRFHTAEAVH